MFLTKEEKGVLIFFVSVVLLGSSINYGKKFLSPQGKISAVFTPAKFRKRKDINSVSYGELVALPHVGPRLAARILRYRHFGGGFRSLEELNKLQGITETERESLRQRLEVR